MRRDPQKNYLVVTTPLIKTPVNSVKTICLRLALALSCLLPHVDSCSAEVFRRFGTAVINGEIKKGDADAFAALFKDGSTYRKIVVTSPGGNIDESIKLGRLIRESGLPIEVWHYCVSSCANFMFLAASQRSIRNGGLVAFHAGSEGWIRMAMPLMAAHRSSSPQEAAIFNEQFSEMRSGYQKLVEHQTAALAAAGVSPTFRDGIFLLTSPRRVSISVDEKTRDLHVSIDAIADATTGFQTALQCQRSESPFLITRVLPVKLHPRSSKSTHHVFTWVLFPRPAKSRHRVNARGTEK